MPGLAPLGDLAVNKAPGVQLKMRNGRGKLGTSNAVRLAHLRVAQSKQTLLHCSNSRVGAILAGAKGHCFLQGLSTRYTVYPGAAGVLHFLYKLSKGLLLLLLF